MHLLFPTGSSQCDIGPAPALVPDAYCGLGSLARSPFSRVMYDSSMGVQMETIVIKPPFYPTTRFPYWVFLTDHNAGIDMNDPVKGRPTVRMWVSGNATRRLFYDDVVLYQHPPNPNDNCTVDPEVPGTAACYLWKPLYIPSNAIAGRDGTLGDGVNGAVLPFTTGPSGVSVPPQTPPIVPSGSPAPSPSSRVTAPTPGGRVQAASRP
jgi:hypothetical protein